MSPRRVMAIESSGLGGSVALQETSSDGGLVLLEQVVLPANCGSVSTLAPAIDAMLRGHRLEAHQLDLIAVTAGPGSFTGLRVGLATAKLLAWAAELPIVPVDSLAAIALRFQSAHLTSFGDLGSPTGSSVALVTIMNAFRKQLFTASWLVDSGGLTPARTSAVVELDHWLRDPWGASLPQPESLWISGPGVLVVPKLADRIPASGSSASPSANWLVAPENLWQPLAEQVGHLGWAQFEAGQAVAADALQANYLRTSAAEEKRRESL